MQITEFIDRYRDAITSKTIKTYPPIYRPSQNGHELSMLKRRPLGAQGDAILGATLSLKTQRGTSVVGEMGTGKTFIASAAAYLAGCRRVLVMCPPHLVRKWRREVLDTVPGAEAAIVQSITDLEQIRQSAAPVLFVILSKERAKLSYRWQSSAVNRWATSRGRLFRDAEGRPYTVPSCPACFAQILDEDGVPLTLEQLGRKKHLCQACRGPLWCADRSGPRRYPLADYVKRRMAGFFDLFVSDEVHELKAKGSAQGIAGGVLASAIPKSLTLTGTLMGGYASTLFYLLYRFTPAIKREFGYREEGRWVTRYGFVEKIVSKSRSDDAFEDGRASRRRGYRTRIQEKPGVMPAVLCKLRGIWPGRPRETQPEDQGVKEGGRLRRRVWGRGPLDREQAAWGNGTVRVPGPSGGDAVLLGRPHPVGHHCRRKPCGLPLIERLAGPAKRGVPAGQGRDGL